jgi:hypothetical protein
MGYFSDFIKASTTSILLAADLHLPVEDFPRERAAKLNLVQHIVSSLPQEIDDPVIVWINPIIRGTAPQFF